MAERCGEEQRSVRSEVTNRRARRRPRGDRSGGRRRSQARAGVPADLRSCHALVVDGYAVEGHVPAATIATLLEERPAIDGIALPEMPAGSPGMGGEKNRSVRRVRDRRRLQRRGFRNYLS
ncbi:DUF411 domain-containing protein [Natronoarchaeum mannanilyticum]|uniref:DUF411 domain-containing protein n=1 Tax=Natronoarchaeum mannanilyticum TaxID=926360 RepID=UPI0031DCE371